MTIRYPFLILLIISIGFIFGCSNKGNPVTIQQGDQTHSSTDYPLVGVTDIFPDGSPYAGMATIGLFQIHLDPNDLSADLIRFRESSLNDVLEVVDITNFLQLTPCTDCVKIKSVSLNTDGNLIVSIGIKHPFEAGNPLNPVSGKNRADLHVFNVEGIIVSNAPATSFPLLGEAVADFSLLNADGYTDYLDSSLDKIFPTGATIHPYILHFDDYSAGNFSPSNPMGFKSVTYPPPSGNLVMAMGCDYNYQDYIFALDGKMDFVYAVGCTYAVSAASRNDRFHPEYRIPQHNKKAASEIDIAIISNDLKGKDASSTAQIQIRVVDINHGIPVGEALNEMLADSSVNSIIVEVPKVMSSPLNVNISSHTGSGHNPSDPLVYSATITNTAKADMGTYTGLVKVKDSYSPGQNSLPILGGMDGIKRVDPAINPLSGLFAISEFATYMVFKVDVAISNNPPVAILKPDPASCQMGDRIDFDATDSYDPDGSITLYEFDFDWDGIQSHFHADTSNTTGLAQSSRYLTAGNPIAGLRVTDNRLAISYDSVTVSVSQINVIYVDNSNTGPIKDGTLQYPYNTIPEGLNAASDGYQVWVDDSGSNYAAPLTISSCNNIALRSINWDYDDGGDMAKIYTNSPNTIITIGNSTNFIIDGFKIYGSYNAGVSIFSSPELAIKNCWITDIGLTFNSSSVTALSILSSNGAKVENTEISHIQQNVSSGGYLNGIYISSSAINVKGCKIHDLVKANTGGTTNIIYCTSCVPQSGYHLEIRQNKIYDIHSPDSGSLIGIYLSSCNQVDIYNNAMYQLISGSGGGIFGIYFSTTSNVNVINNVFYDFQKNDTGSAYVAYSGGSSNTNPTFINNIMGYFHTPGGTAIGGAATGSVVPTNLIWNYNDMFSVANLTQPSGTGNISDNPLFVNASGYNFHLGVGSPCIDTGDPTIQDFDFTRSDMGCYGGPDGNW